MDAQFDEIGTGVALGPLERLTGYHLRRASNVFGTDFLRAVGETGMRQVLFGILSVVSANPGISQALVGRALGVQRANMVALINELVEAGLLDRQAAESDRRAFALTVTPEGERLIAECLRRIEAHEEKLLCGLSASERATLIELLRRIEALER